MKKTVYIALCTMIILGCKIPSASGGETTGQLTKFETITEEPVSEQAGLMWSFDGNTLTISGTGAMPDYADVGETPWYDHLDKITRVSIKQGATSIGRAAFVGCISLTSITIPNSVTRIGYGAFAGCISLTSITIPNSVTRIGDGAFDCCSSLTSITIPNSVTTIGTYAFGGCISLTSITIGNSVTTIGDGAFVGCISLTFITIPNSVTRIGDGAFVGCFSLRNVVVLKTTPPALGGDEIFVGVPLSSATLIVPYGSRLAYRSANGWNQFGTIVGLEN
jgi:hypothetical protein